MWRITTEHKNMGKIREILLANSIPDYTMIPAVGSWKGVEEDSLIIEVSGDNSFYRIAKIASQIAIENQQESVMIQRIKDHPQFITKEDFGIYTGEACLNTSTIS